MIREIAGFILKVLHGILIFALWLSPFYMTNRYWLLGTIAFQTAILAHFHLFEGKCILTMAEEWISGEKIIYYQGKSMAGFNGIIRKIFGTDTMLAINNYVPHFVIIANCYKLSRII
jgi:hypothetical protein